MTLTTHLKSMQNSRVLIVYGSQTGTSKGLAHQSKHWLEERAFENVIVRAMDKIDPEDLNAETAILMICSTYSGGGPPKHAKFFYDWLIAAPEDFRVPKTFLKGCSVFIFGVGNSLYEEQFNIVAKELHTACRKLGATKNRLGLGDVDAGDVAEQFLQWMSSIHSPLTKAVLKVIDAEEDRKETLVDLEDLGSVMNSQTEAAGDTVREMVTPSVRKNLTKQGYKIIGSHSGVKLCRWTKAMLRGRGGCYKHTFYGIKSYQCMEMTPSLACANKCVFCWRHHTNPVGKEWRWLLDEPDMIIEGAVDNHRQMIKQMKGVPGVLPDRFEEAFTIRHCALSLVGEPIMYPHINRFIGMLHDRLISTFLVTNAQFPEAIQNLVPVTQLYVSIDASNKDELKKIDRPLFSDFWERFLDSLRAISAKCQRTVYRLTLVKGFNMDEMLRYSDLVALGKPQFIEVKGVTFCGSSNASDLTMDNVPYHHEVRKFCETLCSVLGNEYLVACEHEHSCCVLIAHKMFLIDDQWHTWIDYDKFQQLAKSGSRFSSLDYMAPTPEWAIYGNEHKGFDPEETRHYRNKKDKHPVEGS